MELSDILLPLLVAMVTASWANLHAILARHEARLIAVERELATKPSRNEFEASRAELRAEITALRTDLTQIALAVGAGRPQASEG